MSKAIEKSVPVTAEPAKAEPSAITPPRPALPTIWGDPVGYMRHFNEEIDHLFHTFGFGRGLALPRFEPFTLPTGFDEMAKAVWSPQVEVFEREGMLHVRADLPGLAKDDVSIEIDNGVLSIKGERKSEKIDKTEKRYHTERMYGSFYRSFRLPERAEVGKATAAFKDGVLEVMMPMPPKPEPTARKLDIK